MMSTESTAPSPPATGGYSRVAGAPSSDFEGRWAAWRARGAAHDRAVRRKAMFAASLAGALATALGIAYTLLHL